MAWAKRRGGDKPSGVELLDRSHQVSLRAKRNDNGFVLQPQGKGARAIAAAYLWRLVVLVTACSLMTVGCPASRQGPGSVAGGEEGLGAPASEAQIVEGSTLDRYKKGLPPEEGGALKDVHFAYDSYDLNEEAHDVLAANAEWLKDNPAVAVEIEGHCDERGTLEYNLALGAKRARAVKDYLASVGIRPARLSTISYGEELPLCRDHTESCWARNRRAHFVLISK